MVLMHPGLKDGPFVTHNLISAQESPVPLPKFHMALRLKILMFSGSKKGTQVYYLFSKKYWQANPPRFPIGAPMERDNPLQDIFMSLLIYDFFSFPQSPRKMIPLHVPYQGPHKQRYSITQVTGLFLHSFIHVCWSLQKGALLHMGKT